MNASCSSRFRLKTSASISRVTIGARPPLPRSSTRSGLREPRRSSTNPRGTTIDATMRPVWSRQALAVDESDARLRVRIARDDADEQRHEQRIEREHAEEQRRAAEDEQILAEELDHSKT